MSSHHIVRDEQEPSLFLPDTSSVSFEQVGQLLEWSPIVIATEDSIGQITGWGTKADVLIYKTYTTTIQDIELYQYPIKLIQSSQGNYLNSVLEYLADRKQKAINIIGNAHELIPEITNTFAENFYIVIFEQDYKVFLVKEGRFNKWVPAGKQFKVDSHIKIQSAENLSLTEQDQSILLTAVSDGFITILSNTPFWLWEKT